LIDIVKVGEMRSGDNKWEKGFEITNSALKMAMERDNLAN